MVYVSFLVLTGWYGAEEEFFNFENVKITTGNEQKISFYPVNASSKRNFVRKVNTLVGTSYNARLTPNQENQSDNETAI